MDAVDFIKTIDKLCKTQKDCAGCPLNGHACDVSTIEIINLYNLKSVQKMVQICEQWAKEHPAKTRKSEFLKLFPNAAMQGIEKTWCVAQFDKTKKCDKNSCGGSYCEKCQEKFWNEEV